MSLFFGLGLSDPVPFGVCGIDTAEAGQFGSTTDNMYIRMFNRDSGSNYKLLNGMALGSSNISGFGTAAINNAFLGTILTDANGSNFVQPAFAVQGRRAGVNYPHTMRAALDVVGEDVNVPIALFTSYATVAGGAGVAGPVVITKNGTVGLGTTTPNEAFAMDIRGSMVACNILMNTIAGANAGNTINAARSSFSNMDYLRTTHAYMEGLVANAGESLLQVRVPGFTALNVQGTGLVSIGSERTFAPSALLTVDGSAYACNLFLNTLQGLRPTNTIEAGGVTFSNVRQYQGQTASLNWTGVTGAGTTGAPSSNILTLTGGAAGGLAIVNASGQWGIQTSNPNPTATVDVIGALHACNIVTTTLRGMGALLEINAQTSVLSNLTRLESARADLLYTGASNTFPVLSVRSPITPVLTALANGQIGIGTSNPNAAALVDILGTVFACNLRINTLRPAAAGSNAIDLLNLTTLSNAVLLHSQQLRLNYPGPAADSNLPILQTTGTGSLTVTSSGRVGIQTTAPRDNTALDVRGNIWGSNATISSLTGHLNATNAIDCTLTTASNIGTVHTDALVVAHRLAASAASTALLVTNPTGGARAVAIMGDGRVGIGTATPSSTPNLLLDVRGDASACNITLSSFQGALPGSAINFQQSSASNINTALANQVRFTYAGAASNYPLIDTSNVPLSSHPLTLWANGQVGLGTSVPASNVRLDILGNIRASNANFTSLTGGLSNSTLDGTLSTLSNLARLITTQEIRMGAVPLFNSNGAINPVVTNTGVLNGAIQVDGPGNVALNGTGLYYSAALQRVGVNTSNPSETLDINGTAVMRTALRTSNIQPMTPEGSIRFNYAKIMEVDQLIVRSNITIENPGLNTVTNLPTDVVRLSQITNRLDSNILPTSTVFLNPTTNQVDAALIPVLPGPNTTTVRTTDAFGIGTRRPAQRLHVNNGNSVVTGGFFGVGLSNPSAVLHVRDTNGPATTVLIEQLGNRNPVQILGAGVTPFPIFTMSSEGRVGLGTYISAATDGLLVQTGVARFAQGISTPLLLSSVNAQNNTLSNLGTLQAATARFTNASIDQRVGINTQSPLFELDVRGALNVTGTANLGRILPNTGSNTLICAGALHIQGSTVTTASVGSMQSFFNAANVPPNVANIGLYVDAFVQSAGYYATSDRRFKTDITPIAPAIALEKVRALEACRYEHRDPTMGPTTIGFIAQDVQRCVPEAVTLRTGFIPDIMQYVSSINAHQFYLQIDAQTPYLAPFDQLRLDIRGEPVPRTVTVQAMNLNANAKRLLVTVVERIPFPGVAGAIFVYGRRSNDMHVMDYDRLVALNSSAIQALLARVEDLERKLASVK